MSFAISLNSVSGTLSYATSTGTGGYGYNTTTATTSAQMQSLFGTNGIKIVGLVFSNTMSLSAGQYWLGYLQNQTTANSAVGLSFQPGGAANLFVTNMQNIGNVVSNFATNQTFYEDMAGFGVYTSTGSAGYGGNTLPSSVFITGISKTGGAFPVMTFISTT